MTTFEWIAATSAVVNSTVFVGGFLWTWRQLRRANRNARLEVYRSLRDAFISMNQLQASNPKFQHLLDQSAETCFLHGMLAQYEFAWRCWQIGELPDEDFARYELALSRLREPFSRAIDLAIYPFDAHFVAFVRSGGRDRDARPAKLA